MLIDQRGRVGREQLIVSIVVSHIAIIVIAIAICRPPAQYCDKTLWREDIRFGARDRARRSIEIFSRTRGSTVALHPAAAAALHSPLI